MIMGLATETRCPEFFYTVPAVRNCIFFFYMCQGFCGVSAAGLDVWGCFNIHNSSQYVGRVMDDCLVVMYYGTVCLVILDTSVEKE